MTNPTIEDDALQAVNDVTELQHRPLDIGQERDQESPPLGYEVAQPRLLEQPIDETLTRLLRTRTKTAKA